MNGSKPNRSNYDLVIVLNKALTGGDSASSGFFIQDFYIVVNKLKGEDTRKDRQICKGGLRIV